MTNEFYFILTNVFKVFQDEGKLPAQKPTVILKYCYVSKAIISYISSNTYIESFSVFIAIKSITRKENVYVGGVIMKQYFLSMFKVFL